MLLSLLLACATHVTSVTVFGEPTLTDAHYLILDADGLAYDCITRPDGEKHEPTCVRVDFRGEPLNPK
ncbi:MAG: hypothetical protein ACOZNI_27710 [Myxococcota bacterium]